MINPPNYKAMFYARINKLKVFNNREGFLGLFNRAGQLPAVLQYQTAGHDAADKYNIIHDIENDGHFLTGNRPGVRAVTALNGFIPANGVNITGKSKFVDFMDDSVLISDCCFRRHQPGSDITKNIINIRFRLRRNADEKPFHGTFKRVMALFSLLQQVLHAVHAYLYRNVRKVCHPVWWKIPPASFLQVNRFRHILRPDSVFGVQELFSFQSDFYNVTKVQMNYQLYKF
jgi:hypothetical protein